MPSGKQTARSQEDAVLILRGVQCWQCGKLESQGQRFMRCGGCEMPAYCSKDCQRGDWPRHKKECKEHKARTADLQALGKLELGAQFDDWFKHRMPILFWMAHTLLENKSSTHVLGVQVDYDPTKSLPFQVKHVAAVPLSALLPHLAHSICEKRSSLSVERPASFGPDTELGFCVFQGNAFPHAHITPMGLHRGVAKKEEPIPQAAYLAFLNMDAEDAIKLLSKHT